MEEAQDGYFFLGGRVQESEGFDQEFPDRWISALGDDASTIREVAQGLGSLENALKDTNCGLSGVLGDELDALVELLARSSCPDYPAAPRTHFRRSSSATSSCDIVRPASASSRPRSMAWIT